VTPQDYVQFAIVPGLTLLPSQMDSAEARAMMLAIALQESELKYRAQIKGPAKSYAQFEAGGGVWNVLLHHASSMWAKRVCARLDIPATIAAVHRAMEFNDPLCAAFTRLNLWTSPRRLTGPTETQAAWELYEAVWLPGKPRPLAWPANYKLAWDTIRPGLIVQEKRV
jgi:hypothetical protein